MLPAELDTFVGRDTEVARGVELVSAHRLVTFVGPGGVGKTRLSIRVAHAVIAAGQCVDAEFVNFADVPDEDSARVMSRLLRVLGAPDNAEDDATAEAALVDHLASRELLLVLDNVEHVSCSVRALVRLLSTAAPGVRVLATSRRYLELPGEHLLTVPPLAHATMPGAVPDAVRLLVDRAGSRGVLVDPRDPVAHRLCELVDGVPLAIEIAAARLDIRTLAEVVADLDRPAALLGPVVHAEPQHHLSLTALMDWSYRLLTPPQRCLWAVLSEFRGHFSPDTAAQVAAHLGFDPGDVLDLVTRLVHSSILSRVQCKGRARFRLIEPVRRYGLTLEPGGVSRDQIRQAHADHVVDVAARGAVEWYGAEEVGWLLRLAEDAPTIAAVMDHLLSRADLVPSGLDLVVSLARTRTHIFAGMLREARTLITAALDAYSRLRPGEHTTTHVVAVALGAWLAYCQGKAGAGDDLLRQAHALHQAVGGAAPYALVLADGARLWLTGAPEDVDQAVALLDHAAEIAAVDGAPGDRAMCTLFAALASGFGGVSGAVERARAHLADTEAAGAEWAISWAAFAVAMAEFTSGEIGPAAAMLACGLRLQHRIGDGWGLAWTVWMAGVIAARQGQPLTAARLLGAVRRMHRGSGISISGLAPWLRVHRAAITSCFARLGDAATKTHLDEGERLPYQQVVDLALSVLDAETPAAPAPGGLTDRELAVVELLAEGAAEGITDQQIADRLHLSVRTVENHLAGARGKLGAPSRIALVVMWTKINA